MSEESKNCPKCGAPIPENAPEGLCPKCLLLGANTDTEPGYTSTLRMPKPDAPSVAQLAEAFPRFEILELIGQGGMGYVYKARQERLDRIVALKILPEVLATDPAFAERFSREGRLLAKLNHPNIVTVHDFGVTDPTPAPEQVGETVATAARKGERASASLPEVKPTHRYYYLVMEYVDGANLRQAMRAGRFTPEQALNVVPKVCDALQYAHDEGVLHRDIKPENILVDTKGRVKIADFGIAKLVDPAEAKGDVTLTGEGSTLGTPHYMAPEQIEQPSKVDHRADIYSLGVVFYEMLTGELPIGRFAPPSEKTSVNAQVDEIVFRALEKERELRQQSATQIKTEVMNAAHLAPAPPAMRTPRTEVSKTAQCFLTMPDHLLTFKARFSHPFTVAGDLMLEPDQLVFETPDSLLTFPLKNITDVSVGQLEWWSQKGGISVISITLEKDGLQRTLMLRPSGPWPEPVLQSNRHVAEWADDIRKAIEAVGSQARETPSESLPLPPAPKWIVPTCIASIMFIPLFGFLGAEVVGNGERHDDWLAIGLGFGLIIAVLTAAMFCLIASLTFTSTRWALGRGNLFGLTLPLTEGSPTPGAPEKRSATAGAAVAFGAVLLYLGTALCFPLASLFRMGESGLVGCFGIVFSLAVIAAVAVWEKGLPGRIWMRSGSVIAGLLALPVIPFAGFFLYALSEDPSWNPATTEAVIVPLFLLGAFLLPWAAFRLHRACGPRPAPVSDGPQINPWPARIFWFLVITIVAPVLLFVLFLTVPYLAHQKDGPVRQETKVAVRDVFVSKNVLVLDTEIWVRHGHFSLTPKFVGPRLSADAWEGTPQLPGVMLIQPTPAGESPLASSRLDANTMGLSTKTPFRVGFVFPDEGTAALAAIQVQKSMRDYRASKPQIRSSIFLFQLNQNERNEMAGHLNFARARKLSVVDVIKADPVPVAKPEQEPASSEVVLLNPEAEVILADVTLTPDLLKNGRTNWIVKTELEVRTWPSVRKIGVNYRGTKADESPDSVGRQPVAGQVFLPDYNEDPYYFPVAPAGPQPSTGMSTTVRFRAPDAAAAQEIVRQLRVLKPKREHRYPDPDDGYRKILLFDLPKTSMGPHVAWVTIGGKVPAESRSGLPKAEAPKMDYAALVLGTWELKLPLVKAALSFNPDNTFVSSVTLFGKQSSSLGRWQIDGKVLEFETTESANQESIGRVERSEILTLNQTSLIMRTTGKSGEPKIQSFERAIPGTIAKPIANSKRKKFEMRHRSAGEIAAELRQILKHDADAVIEVAKDNQSFTVGGGDNSLNLAQTLVTVLDWPTGLSRRSNYDYPRNTVMDTMRAFFYACAIKESKAVFNKMLSVSALNKLVTGGEGLPPEFLLNQDKRRIAEKELREADWPDKGKMFERMAEEINRKPLKSLQQEPGVALGFGARYFVIANFGGTNPKSLRFSVSIEPRKDNKGPIRYLVDGWNVVQPETMK